MPIWHISLLETLALVDFIQPYVRAALQVHFFGAETSWTLSALFFVVSFMVRSRKPFTGCMETAGLPIKSFGSRDRERKSLGKLADVIALVL